MCRWIRSRLVCGRTGEWAPNGATDRCAGSCPKPTNDPPRSRDDCPVCIQITQKKARLAALSSFKTTTLPKLVPQATDKTPATVARVLKEEEETLELLKELEAGHLGEPELRVTQDNQQIYALKRKQQAERKKLADKRHLEDFLAQAKKTRELETASSQINEQNMK